MHEIESIFVNHAVLCVTLAVVCCIGKSVPLQAWSGPEGSRKLPFADLMTTAQDGSKVDLRTGRLYPRKCSWYSFLLEAESTPGP